MKRRVPNPWIVIPSAALGLLAAALGWTVTYISCGPGSGCLVWSSLVAALSLVAVTIGTALLLILVYRSIAEWREAEEGGRPPSRGSETTET